MESTSARSENRNVYFAAEEDGERLARRLYGWVTDYYEYLKSTGRLALYQRSYEEYYKGAFHKGQIEREGELAEFSRLNINHYRSILQSIIVMATNQRPAFKARANNTDHKSQAQTKIAQGLLQYYLREKRLERLLYAALEHASYQEEGFLTVLWDPTAGRDYIGDPATGEVAKTGDIVYGAYGPTDVIRDFTKSTSQGHRWYTVREFSNRFELAARCPDQEEKILKAATKTEEECAQPFLTSSQKFRQYETDEVSTYRFYHARTPAMPDGRYTEFLNNGTVLYDGPLPYRDLPVLRVAAGEQHHSPHGYTIASDMLPIQKAIAGLASAITTNQANCAVQNIVIQEGSNVGAPQVMGGMNIMTVKAGTTILPQGINLSKTAPETFQYLDFLVHAMETTSGVNSVARGNADPKLSGSAMALIQSQAIQFSSGIQNSYMGLQEDAGTLTIHVLQDYAKAPQIAMIEGISNRPYLREFTGADIDQIDRVSVDVTSAVMQTEAGRVSAAENLLAAKLVTNPQQYFQVISDGQTEAMTEGPEAQLMNIRAENEKLAIGELPTVNIYDDAPLHIKEHLVVIASPEAREDPDIVLATLTHVQQHMMEWRMADPGVLMTLGIPVAPPPPMAPQIMPPGMMPGVPTQTPPPQPGVPSISEGMTEPQGGGQQPRMPQMPKNPLTGERAPAPQ